MKHSKITLVSEILKFFVFNVIYQKDRNHGASGSWAQDNDSSAFTQQRNCHQRGGNTFTEPQSYHRLLIQCTYLLPERLYNQWFYVDGMIVWSYLCHLSIAHVVSQANCL